MKSSQDQRILHVPRRFVSQEWGGTETVILEISRQQQREGWQPEILTSAALSDVPSESIEGIPVRRYPYCYPFLGLSAGEKLSMDKKGGNLLSLALFSALLRRPEVRIFHAHALNRLGGTVRTAARFRKKPYVVTIHGGVFDVPASELEAMTRAGRNHWEWGKLFGALFGSRRVLEDANHVICVGEGELAKARQNLGHSRVSFLPNGVDPGKFSRGGGAAFRAKHRISKEAFLALCLSRIDAQKNQMLLLKAFAALHRDRPDSRLLLIGPETQPSYAENLRIFVRQSGLHDAVTILPGLRPDDPDRFAAYDACDVFVLPSVHEPFGIVVLEAWCSAKAVVVSRIGGLRSLVNDGVTGLFIEHSDDPSELAARLKTLAADPGLRSRLGDQGLQEAKREYTWEAVNRRLESIYGAAEDHARNQRS